MTKHNCGQTKGSYGSYTENEEPSDVFSSLATTKSQSSPRRTTLEKVLIAPVRRKLSTIGFVFHDEKYRSQMYDRTMKGWKTEERKGRPAPCLVSTVKSRAVLLSSRIIPLSSKTATSY